MLFQLLRSALGDVSAFAFIDVTDIFVSGHALMEFIRDLNEHRVIRDLTNLDAADAVVVPAVVLSRPWILLKLHTFT